MKTTYRSRYRNLNLKISYSRYWYLSNKGFTDEQIKNMDKNKRNSYMKKYKELGLPISYKTYWNYASLGGFSDEEIVEKYNNGEMKVGGNRIKGITQTEKWKKWKKETGGEKSKQWYRINILGL